jgi:hypothetical protein
MASSPPSSTLSSLRGFFSREEKEKLPADLKRALSILQLTDIATLEERFLATEAFLRPWAVFRDSISILQPDAMPRGTPIDTASATSISRLDILWFYTQFDEDARRYDPRADKSSREYTTDSSVYGVISKRGWTVVDYEKHLYAWLLQTFGVGKARNIWGFDYFELRNICTAWEAVFVPVLNAVRASYNIKGRRHYGRLALFIEERCPSRLAFPEDNVGFSADNTGSSIPLRLVSMPKMKVGSDGTTFQKRTHNVGILTRKHYDEAEKELRDVYPQYGGLVERPKFKHKMEEWLAEQRARADIKKAAVRHGEIHSHQPQIVQRQGSGSSTKKRISPRKAKRQASHDGSPRSIKRYSDSIRRSLTRDGSKKTAKEEPKSPLHGVTRQLHIPDDPSHHPTLANQQVVTSTVPPTDLVTPWPTSEPGPRPYEQIVCTAIRKSNPFSEDPPAEVLPSQQIPGNMATSIVSEVDSNAHSRPLPRDHEHGVSFATLRDEVLAIRAKKSYGDIRVPSYEGTGYTDEISLTNLRKVRRDVVRTPDPLRSVTPRSRLPAPIKPVSYAGHLRTTAGDAHRKDPPKPVSRSEIAAPKHVPWPGSSLPRSLPWPGSDSDGETTPPLPPKSPERWNSVRGHVEGSHAQQVVRDEAESMSRIVSKENIRAALGRMSRGSSVEDLDPPMPMRSVPSPERTMSPDGVKLATYNTHLFPRKEDRKGTPVGDWITKTRKHYEGGRTYEKVDRQGQEQGF